MVVLSSQRLTTIGHHRGTGNRLKEAGTGQNADHSLLVSPDPQPRGCTNETTPCGESPEATRPESARHTARHRGHARARRDRRGCEPLRASPHAGTLLERRPGTFTRPNVRGHARAGDFPAMFLESGSGDAPQNMNGKSCFPHVICV